MRPQGAGTPRDDAARSIGDDVLRKLVIVIVIFGAAAVAAFWFATAPRALPADVLAASHAPDLANGKTVFHAGGCAACHAMPNPDDKTKLGGGSELKSPFGTFYPPNISSDPTDGIGAWSEAEFVNAMRHGVSPDGRHYYPAFPYPSYQHMTTDDLRDLFAYLNTLPAVRGRVRDHALAFPYNIRRLVGGWKLLFLDGEPLRPDPSQSAKWNRGAYLVNALGHCAECHSPRNTLAGIVAGQRFAGGPSPDGEGWIPNITQKGIGDYSEDDIAQILETGEMPNGDTVGGLMGPVVRNIKELPPADRAAMAAYIKSLPPVEGPKPPESK